MPSLFPFLLVSGPSGVQCSMCSKHKTRSLPSESLPVCFSELCNNSNLNNTKRRVSVAYETAGGEAKDC